MLIYKILTEGQWDDLRTRGETPGAPVDLADGFIHFSTSAQVRETAARHFGGQDGLWLVSVEADTLNDLRWEPSRGGDLFPHLYGPLRHADVIEAQALPLEAGAHRFPAGIP